MSLSLLMVLTASANAAPITFQLAGVGDFNNQATVTFAYDASLAKVLLDISNTSAQFDPRITGFAFNAPTGVSGVSSLSGPAGWAKTFSSNGLDTPGQFGFFDVGGITGPNLNGGSPNAGIPLGSTFHFEIALLGSGLGALTESSFLSLLSHDPPGGANEDEQYFVARFQRTGADGLGSDVGIPHVPKIPAVPEPATILLLGSAVSVLGLRARRKHAQGK